MESRPRYRVLRLDGHLEELHQAMDRLRVDIAPTPLDHQPTSLPTPRRRRRQDPSDGQAALLQEAS
jgi:hypothetical protein